MRPSVALLDEHMNREQANIFLRTIKMINERKDETIRHLLDISTGSAESANFVAKNSTGATSLASLASPTSSASLASPARQRGRATVEGSPQQTHSWTGQFGELEKFENHERNDQEDRDGESNRKVNKNRNDRARNDTLTPGADTKVSIVFQGHERTVGGGNKTLVVPSDKPHHLGSAPLGGDDSHKPEVAEEPSSVARATLGRRQGRPNRQISGQVQFKLEPMIEFIKDKHNSLEADEKVCQLIKWGGQVIFGPSEGSSIQHVQSICDTMDIAHFELQPFGGSSWREHRPARLSRVARADGWQVQQEEQEEQKGRKQEEQQQQQETPPRSSWPETSQENSRDAPSLAQLNPWALQNGSTSPDDDNKHNLLQFELNAEPNAGLKRQLAQSNGAPRSESGGGSGSGQGHLGDPGDYADNNSNGNRNNKPQPDSDDYRAPNGLTWAQGRREKHGAGSKLKQPEQPRDYNLQVDRKLQQEPGKEEEQQEQERGQVNGQADEWHFSADPIEGQPAAKTGTGSGSGGGEQEHKDRTIRSLVSTFPASVSLYPPARLLNSAYIDLIDAWNWSSFAIVYESSDSMVKLQDLFRESSGSWRSKWQIKLFQLDPALDTPTQMVAAQPEPTTPPVGSRSNYSELFAGPHKRPRAATTSGQRRAGFRDIFWRIKKSGELNILLDVKTERLYETLKQAQQVGCMTERFSYLITSMDLHTIELEDFKYSRARLTSLSLLQTPGSRVGAPVKLTRSPRASTSGLRPASGSSARTWSNPSDRLGVAKQPDVSFDEHYLGRLGVYDAVLSEEPSVRPQSAGTSAAAAAAAAAAGARLSEEPAGGGQLARPLPKVSPSVVLNRVPGGFMEPTRDAVTRDPATPPAQMGALPAPDRDHEQRLFEFLVSLERQNLTNLRMSTSSAIIHDSLLLCLLALVDLEPSAVAAAAAAAAPPATPPPSSRAAEQSGCAPNSQRQPLIPGSTLMEFARRANFVGLTGPISFDKRGLRSDFRLEILSLAPNIGLVKVGEWHSSLANEPISNGHQASHLRSHQLPVSEEPSNGLETSGSSGSQVETVKSYGELALEYEVQLRNYEKLIAQGVKLVVPYDKLVSRHLALRVNQIIFERLYCEQTDQVDTLIVTTKLSQPYFMLKETPSKLDGNDQYEGFAVDLVHELSKLVNFKYRWREAADKKYGSKTVVLHPNGSESVQWNGLIGEIVRGQADLAIVDLTITAQREEAVDFTLPFMNTGISILFKKPTTKVTTLFSFLSPFSSDVWAYVLAAYCGISAILFIVGHMSPYEWSDLHPCRHTSAQSEELDEDGYKQTRYDDHDEQWSSRPGTTVLKNQFSLLNSFWFTIGSLMQQGSDLTPRSMSTRTIAGIWYFFTLIMISSYTANLAAFLTVEKVVYLIENVRDLSNQNEIKYGCVESGSTCLFFQDSQISTYKRINENMKRFRTYVRSNDEGQKRVEEGKFAFFMESTSIEYIVERNCNLTQIGGLLDSKGYGIATSKKSRLKRPYRTLLSEGILHLQETGMLHMLKNRWWKERRGGGTCTDDGKGGGVTELSLANVGGVFVVLLGGLGISFLVAIAEFMWRARRQGSTRDKMCEEMMADLKFALACKSSTKPVKNLNRKSTSNRLSRRAADWRTNQVAPDLSSSASQAMMPNNASLYQVSGPNNGRLDTIQKDASSGVCGTKKNRKRQVQPSGKACDPILFHAMLALLEQQQALAQGEQQH